MMIQNFKKISVKGIIHFLVLVTLAACGGGGGDGTGPVIAPGAPRIDVVINPASAIIPLNPANASQYPDFDSPSLISLGITTYRGDAITQPTSINVAPVSVTSRGAMAYMDSDEAHKVDCGTEQTPKKCPGLFHNLVFKDIAPPVHAYFYAVPGGSGGEEVIRITTTFTDGTSAQKDIKIFIGNNDGGKPASAQVEFNSPINVNAVANGTIRVFDGANSPVVGGRDYDSLEFVVDDDSFRAGARVAATSYKGESQSAFAQSAQASTAQNGVATFSVKAAGDARQMQISVYVDQADNNVTNGYVNKVLLGTLSVVVQTAPVVQDVERLTFTGDFANATSKGANFAKLGGGDAFTVSNGVNTYARSISVLASDQFGRPAGSGGRVQFYLIDGPTKGFPLASRGDFIHKGVMGNVPSTGNIFTSIDKADSINGDINLNPVLAGCKLVFGLGIGDSQSTNISDASFAPFERGFRVLSEAPQVPSLPSVNNPIKMVVDRNFNPTFDTGYTVPWVVGCGGTNGSVLNGDGRGAVINDKGVASDVLNYPSSYVGHNFVLVAEYTRKDGKVISAVMNHWYLADVPTAKLSTLSSSIYFGNTLMTVRTPNTAGTKPALVPVDVLSNGMPDYTKHSDFIVNRNDIKVTLTDNNGVPIAGELISCRVSSMDSASIVIEKYKAAAIAYSACDKSKGGCTIEKELLDNAEYAKEYSQFLSKISYSPSSVNSGTAGRTDVNGNIFVDLTLWGWPSDPATRGKLQCGSIGQEGTNISNMVEIDVYFGGGTK